MNIKGYSKIEGIVLKTIPFKETSEIVYLYTAYGIKSIIVKGAKRYKTSKLSFCTPLTRVLAITNKSEFPTLIDYNIIDDYNILKKDLKKSLWCQFLIGILSKIEEIDFCDKVYNMLIKTFELTKDNDVILLVLSNMIKLTKAFGVEPNFKTCVTCNSLDVSFFSVSSGGALCKEHKTSDALNNDTLNILKKLYYIDLDDINNLAYLNTKELYKIIISYYEWHLNLKLNYKDSLIF